MKFDARSTVSASTLFGGFTSFPFFDFDLSLSSPSRFNLTGVCGGVEYAIGDDLSQILLFFLRATPKMLCQKVLRSNVCVRSALQKRAPTRRTKNSLKQCDGRGGGKVRDN